MSETNRQKILHLTIYIMMLEDVGSNKIKLVVSTKLLKIKLVDSTKLLSTSQQDFGLPLQIFLGQCLCLTFGSWFHTI